MRKLLILILVYNALYTPIETSMNDFISLEMFYKALTFETMNMFYEKLHCFRL